MLDNVSVADAPEPSFLPVMLGLAAAVLRRRLR